MNAVAVAFAVIVVFKTVGLLDIGRHLLVRCRQECFVEHLLHSRRYTCLRWRERFVYEVEVGIVDFNKRLYFVSASNKLGWLERIQHLVCHIGNGRIETPTLPYFPLRTPSGQDARGLVRCLKIEFWRYALTVSISTYSLIVVVIHSRRFNKFRIVTAQERA